MGTQEAREKQEDLFYASEQAEAPGHPFYQQLNGVLEEAKFDAFCEQRCRTFYIRNWAGRRWRRACISGCC